MEINYFTDPRLRALLRAPDHARPVALHMEYQSGLWLEGGQIRRHGQLCAEILRRPLAAEARGWDCGLLDSPAALTDIFRAAAAHPAVRLITISTSYRDNHDSPAADAVAADKTLVLRAVGNHGADWRARRAHDSLSMLHSLPGYIRVGEAKRDGTPQAESQASGPAFLCSHPFHLDPGYGFRFYPSQKELDDFFNHVRQRGYGCSPAMASERAGAVVRNIFGTSFATPHAGAMIMHHSADLAGMTPYDILPAVLMAAQDNKPRGGDLIRNRAGLVFDMARSGFGFLDDAPLALRLKQVAAAGTGAQAMTVAAQGGARLETPDASGPVVNVALLLSFRTDRSGARAENDVPLYADLKSPGGTTLRLPLLIERHKNPGQDGTIRAGFQSAAFFGERIDRGAWAVSFPRRSLFGRYHLHDAKIIAHCLPKDSPAASLLPRV
ncbi:MAG: hypothetical protein HYU57_00195 [Micavibrio aeruginosavorus]|nr:hypothetical protein [Micavibrio aeruginosavorus]